MPLPPPLLSSDRGMPLGPARCHTARWRASGALLSSHHRGERPMSEAPILRVDQLSRHFPVRNMFGWTTGAVRALDDVSFEVRPGETLGIVGESGCGKSTLGKTLVGIHRAGGRRIVFQGKDITGQSSSERRAAAPKLQYCYQDPGNSLDPRWTVRRSLTEPLIVHTALEPRDRNARIREILQQVGLPPTHLDLYPHELSGGQQRRVGPPPTPAPTPRLLPAPLAAPASGLSR